MEEGRMMELLQCSIVYNGMMQALEDALFEHEALLQSRERYRAMSMDPEVRARQFNSCFTSSHGDIAVMKLYNCLGIIGQSN